MDEFVERRRKVTCFESLHGLYELFFNEIVGRETGLLHVGSHKIHVIFTIFL